MEANIKKRPQKGLIDEQKVLDMLRERNPRYSLEQEFYNNQELFDIDMKSIFEREWLFAGLTCEIPDKGNYIAFEVGNNPVMITRGDNGEVYALHNVCRHRGSKICTKHRGKSAKLVCPYHQWTYNMDGELIYAGQEMGSDFDKKKFSLKPIHCKTAGGYIFISLAENPPEIDEFLKDLEHYLEPYDLENAKVAVQSVMMEEANWKLVIENNRECYHCEGSHPELLGSLLEWDDTNDPRASDEFKALVAEKQKIWDENGIPHEHKSAYGNQNRIVRMPLKDGVSAMTMNGEVGCKKLMGRINTPDLGSMRILHLPNSWNHAQGDHLIAFQVIPVAPQLSKVITKWIVHKDAVEGIDYDVDNLRKVWDATNDQDRILGETNQLGINSMAYEPGPYSETYEFGVINFINWYADKMLANLDSGMVDNE
ncbi:aromatic ring-hydroxylating oxygenase subunit alpha [Vibrio penaeicida]|uniref:(2Fe-2S)-binding protein n=1 Tax=Vibrio penaeicida TaxID=104609 RepID=A0AAV5NYK3_9VIBR|nr:aromatic ring-hydroxylating dioxygenase subunit alpha [Vibrio penaeicida]RTZ21775.1 aromatic ring-hydroxylating dioxygenase subunit alpha [Vibrio penaeicida]GLQ75640.1 (2Fe-2S)-binding protein [Vibrio penaeicida]